MTIIEPEARGRNEDCPVGGVLCCDQLRQEHERQRKESRKRELHGGLCC